MTVNQALEELLEASKNSENIENKEMINEDNLCYGFARIGSESQIIKAGKIKDIIKYDFGKPLHSVVLCAKTLSSIEKEVVEFYSK